MVPANFLLKDLLLSADPVVKTAIAVLVFFSVWCWAIIVDKALELIKARRTVARIERDLSNGGDLALNGSNLQHPVAAVLEAGSREWRDGQPNDGERESRAEKRERIERAMRAALSGELRRLQKRLPFLATVSSAAPFIGLFGTVWGIMNSFTSIARSHNTSLAVVAPGIAEALLATAIGLVAAIPAVMAYNKFATEFSAYAGRVQAIIGAYGARLTRIKPGGS
ncbi:MAG TPA: MotA/TolQ/ExbB proton channel family protein [Gammaproteobacteria bacterium]|nr:MotA/TolQ/ExbB proton channel family protein [Gammaproteobacteria bacterium]